MRVLTLVAAFGLSACARVDGVLTRGFASVGGVSFGSAIGVSPIDPLPNSVTVQRVRAGGGSAGMEQLRNEEGNVWPPEEGPRATLANPDEALRGIPGYRPGNEANSPLPQRSEAPARGPSRGSAAAFEPPPGYVAPRGFEPAPAAPLPQTVLPASTVNAGGANRVVTGRSGNTATTIAPSGQPGVLLGAPGGPQVLQEPGRPAQQILPRP